MRVFINPELPKPTLWLVGTGNLINHLGQLATQVGFKVSRLDAELRPSEFSPDALTNGHDEGCYPIFAEPDDFIVIATPEKNIRSILIRALETEVCYIGLTEKDDGTEHQINQMINTNDQTSRVSFPAGLDLGARTAQEAALSILSEIVMVRRAGTGGRQQDKCNSTMNAMYAAEPTR